MKKISSLILSVLQALFLRDLEEREEELREAIAKLVVEGLEELKDALEELKVSKK